MIPIIQVPIWPGDTTGSKQRLPAGKSKWWDKHREKYVNIQRMDRILEAEGDSPNNYKITKQADVLMLFYLFSAPELKTLFKQLGYPVEYETIPSNIDYYVHRTTYGSSLNWVVHSWVIDTIRRQPTRAGTKYGHRSTTQPHGGSAGN